MSKINEKKNVKMNLTMESEAYRILKENAGNDYGKVATYAKLLLMKSLRDRNKLGLNYGSQNGTAMAE